MPSRFRPTLVALLALATIASALPAQTPQPRALDRVNLDTTCQACEDFYSFANGGWIHRSSIPAAYSTWGSFNELSDRNVDVVHAVLDDAAAAVGAGSATKGSNQWKVGTYYASCMDTTTIERLGLAPITPVMKRIDALRSNADVAKTLGWLESEAGLAPFGFYSQQDEKNTSRVIVVASQGGLGLPEREYYFRTDAKSAALRDAYIGHVASMLRLAGESETAAAADARRVMDLEMALARASMTRVEMRDPDKTYHLMSLGDFSSSAPHLAIPAVLKTLGAPAVTEIDVVQPNFFRAVDSLVMAAPVDAWKAYLRWHLLDSAAPSLSSAFVAENFNWDKQLTGASEQLPRWRRCADATQRALGEAVGQEYVKRAFTPQAKARALEMVNNLRDVLREDLGRLPWMTDSTRRQAIAKLDAYMRKIGYPDTWRDYSKLEVEPAKYYANTRHATAFSRARGWSKIGKPVDRTEWGMTPPTVNAYYNPLQNEIVFPAGILQPPFFNADADDAVNYGAMGAVMGHEMTHGFDDQGRRYDAQGNLRDWWTAADAEKYTRQAKLVEEQFNSYTVLGDLHVNGKLTLGENIADLGGLKIAYLAMQKALAKKGRPGLIDGFTPEQRFFLGWAQVWRELRRPEAMRTRVLTNEHAPAQWRVNGPLSNMPEFAQAWGCKAGDKMVRPDAMRAEIW